MLSAVRQVQKPCIVFKIFAGGQFYDKTEGKIPALTEQSMRAVYAGIKPTDTVMVGAFQKLKNQIRENAEICARMLG